MERMLEGGVLASSVAWAGCTMTRPARTAPLAMPAGLAVQAVHFPSASGSTIHAWLVPGATGAGAIVLLHGVGDNRTSMLGRAAFLHRAGYALLLPDFQAHGESDGRAITFGALESLDAAAAVDFLRASTGGERIGLIGVSMGGAAALLGPGPVRADAFVLESVYPTIRQALDDRLAVWLGPFGALRRFVTPLVIQGVSGEIGIGEDALRPIDRVGQAGAPVFLLAGTRDSYTPLAEARELFARASEPREFWPVEGAGHEDLHAFAGADYERRVGAFLERYLRPQRISRHPLPDRLTSF